MDQMGEKQGTLVLIFLLLCCRHTVYAMTGRQFGRGRDVCSVPFCVTTTGSADRRGIITTQMCIRQEKVDHIC